MELRQQQFIDMFAGRRIIIVGCGHSSKPFVKHVKIPSGYSVWTAKRGIVLCDQVDVYCDMPEFYERDNMFHESRTTNILYCRHEEFSLTKTTYNYFFERTNFTKGLSSGVDLIKLADMCGPKEIVVSGIDLGRGGYFWDKQKPSKWYKQKHLRHDIAVLKQVKNCYALFDSPVLSYLDKASNVNLRQRCLR